MKAVICTTNHKGKVLDASDFVIGEIETLAFDGPVVGDTWTLFLGIFEDSVAQKIVKYLTANPQAEFKATDLTSAVKELLATAWRIAADQYV